MIKVTLGGVKTKEEKPFPKLMISKIGQIVFMEGINSERDDLLVGYLLHSSGYEIGGTKFTKNWCKDFFTDYNEPITIQNA